MNRAVLDYVLRLTAVAATIQATGLTEQLSAHLDALVQEAQDHILEPKDDGTPWTRADLLAMQREHNQNTAAIRDRHTS